MSRAIALALLLWSLLLWSSPLLAQQPTRDPLEIALIQQWQAAQTGQQNVGEAVSRLLEAWRKDRAALAEAKAEIKAASEKCGEPEAEK